MMKRTLESLFLFVIKFNCLIVINECVGKRKEHSLNKKSNRYQAR